MKCPKCEGEMEEGFTTDHVMRRVELPIWYSGIFQRTFWGGLGLRKRDSYYVRTMRCTECGFLEWYAK